MFVFRGAKRYDSRPVRALIAVNKGKAMPAIYVDADACPVKAEVVKVAERHGVQVFIVSNGGIRPNPHPLVETVIVPEGPDAADMWIAERIGLGDLCVTGDIPLADRCLKAEARALDHRGEAFTEANIGMALAIRDLKADLRAADPLNTGGGGARAFGPKDRSRFLEALERELRRKS